MRERPILFNSEMVRAILENRKSQTRRVVKPQPVGGDVVCKQGMEENWLFGQLRDSEDAWRTIRCPYGARRDVLWVREKFQGTAWPFNYGATPTTDPPSTPWKPSIHMPRAACRITLEVVNVRVERVASISEEDAKAEGVSLTRPDRTGTTASFSSYRDAFAHLWYLINAGRGYGWESNPWCWVVEFKMEEK